MNFKKVLVSVMLLTASVGEVSVAPSVTKAAVTQKTPTIKNTPLTKEGYNVRFINNKFADKVYVGQDNYKKLVSGPKGYEDGMKDAKTISPKKIQNVKFRIEKVAIMHAKGFGAPSYFVASKDKKYSAWTTQSGLQYFYLNSKSAAMKAVKKHLANIANRNGSSVKTKAGKRDFNLAMKAAKKLPKSQRAFVVSHLNQLKKVGTMDVEGVNLLLFGF